MSQGDRGRRKAAKAQRRDARLQKERQAKAARSERGAWADREVRMLLEDGMTTSGIDLARHGLPAGSKATLAREMLLAFLDLDLSEIEPADIWKFAPTLSYLFGPEVARQVVNQLAASPRMPDPALMLLETAVEPPEDPAAEPPAAAPHPALPEAPPLFEQLAALADTDPLEALTVAFATPRPQRGAIVAQLLATLTPGENTRGFLALGVLTPALGAEVRARLIDALAREAHPAGLAFLADLGEDELGPGLHAYARRQLMRVGWTPPATQPPPIAASPLAWPVVHVFESKVDGTGSQGTYLVRQRGAAHFALYGVIANDRRGAVDGIGAEDLDAHELAQTLAHWQSAGVRPTSLTPARAAARMAEAIARGEALGHPLPYEVALYRSLLAGVSRQAAPARAARSARSAPASPDLAHTPAVLHTVAGQALRMACTDSPPARDFIHGAQALLQQLEAGRRSRGSKPAFPPELMRGLDRPYRLVAAPDSIKLLGEFAARHAEAVFTPALRTAWQAQLAACARTFAQSERPALAALAEAAAGAIAPGSGVPIGAQPLAIAALVRSVFGGHHGHHGGDGHQGQGGHPGEDGYPGEDGHHGENGHHGPAAHHSDPGDHARAMPQPQPGQPGHRPPQPAPRPASSGAAAPHSAARSGADARAEATGGLMAFAAPYFDALPFNRPAAYYRRAMLPVIALWNAGAASWPMGEVLARARAAAELLLEDEKPALRKAVLAALDTLPGRWATDFAGERRQVAEVRARRRGHDVVLEVVYRVD